MCAPASTAMRVPAGTASATAATMRLGEKGPSSGARASARIPLCAAAISPAVQPPAGTASASSAAVAERSPTSVAAEARYGRATAWVVASTTGAA
jgi:hypothetical protein